MNGGDVSRRSNDDTFDGPESVDVLLHYKIGTSSESCYSHKHSGDVPDQAEIESYDEKEMVPTIVHEEANRVHMKPPPVPLEVSSDCGQSSVSSITNMLPLGSIYPASHAVEATLSLENTSRAAARVPPPDEVPPMASLQTLETRVLAKVAKSSTTNPTDSLQPEVPNEPKMSKEQIATSETTKERAHQEIPSQAEQFVIAASRCAEPGAYAEAGGVNRSEFHHQRAMGGTGTPTVTLETTDQESQQEPGETTQDGLARASLVVATNSDNMQVARKVDRSDQGKKGTENSCTGRFILGVFISILCILLAITIPLAFLLVQGNSDGATTVNHPRESFRIEMEGQLALALGDVISERFETPISPYSKALNWLLYDDPLELVPGFHNHESLVQRFIMALFYFQTSAINGKWTTCNPRPNNNETNQTATTGHCYFRYRYRPTIPTIASHIVEREVVSFRWLSGQHECQWAGIQCNLTSKRVTEMHLFDFNLTGTIPSELARLEDLQVLSLPKNRLHGSPSSELGILKQLKQINLESNSLSRSPIPNEWFHLESLTHLNLGSNQFSPAPLSTQIAKLSSLQKLDLSYAGLTGTLPIELFQLTDLRNLALWFNNNLNGTLGTEMGLLSKVEFFSIGNSLIEGTLPSEIGSMRELREFDAGKCLFTGTIPEEIYHSLVRLSSLSLAENQLSGTISSFIGQISGLKYLLIHKNRFSGTLPTEMGLLTRAKRIGVNLNNLTGSIPSELCALRGDSKLFRLKADCAPASSTGEIPVFCPTGCCTKCCDQDIGICQKVEDY